jgi:hypothetical protein
VSRATDIFVRLHGPSAEFRERIQRQLVKNTLGQCRDLLLEVEAREHLAQRLPSYVVAAAAVPDYVSPSTRLFERSPRRPVNNCPGSSDDHDAVLRAECRGHCRIAVAAHGDFRGGPGCSYEAFKPKAIISGAARCKEGADVRGFLRHDGEKLR